VRSRRGFSFACRVLVTGVALIMAACSALPGDKLASMVSPTASLRLPSPTSTESSPNLTASSTPQPAFPDPAGYDWVPVVQGLELPVDIQNAGDGSGRLFIVEKRGRILIRQNGQLLPTPFLDIINEAGSQHNEQGLLGLAFHPKYAENGLFFVNYTDKNGNTVIARFQVSAGDPNRADPMSEVDLMHIDQPYANHNGGGLAFGPDGYLYIGLGDGGSAGDPHGNGQNLQTQLGKLLRIDVDHGDPYAIPPDNPFIGIGMPEIWAYGLRNPWRFSFDTLTGNLYIADVGQDAWEEVDLVPAGTAGGLNFGWNYMEGTHSYQGQPLVNLQLTSPIAEYSHADGCSVTGGYVYRGVDLPEWQGIYLYGDYCSGNIWGLITTGQAGPQTRLLFTTGAQISTFGLDEAGEIYLVDYGTSAILQLVRR
jgi:glucose/arabinose dehydrogenase